MSAILGHHHMSMIVKDAVTTNKFYKEVLGLRRVKISVNQDDPSMYHLFYGDLTGSPGTELTFFEMPAVGKTHRGTNAITQIGLLVPSVESLTYWKNRFEALDVKHGEITTYANREALSFEDPDGLRLILLNKKDANIPGFWEPWDKSDIKKDHLILGIGSVEITVRDIKSTKDALQEIFRYIEVSASEKEIIMQSIEGEIFGEIVLKEEAGSVERPGRGSVHHLAIRAKNEEELRMWEEKIKEKGFVSTGVIDRYYFHSLYFRDANRIMFEIATDEPGFTVDSTIEDLGSKLDLPPFLEDKRQEIVDKLKPIE
ncbi:ring-cleaving dioxygenase [Virgibacillus oceani]